VRAGVMQLLPPDVHALREVPLEVLCQCLLHLAVRGAEGIREQCIDVLQEATHQKADPGPRDFCLSALNRMQRAPELEIDVHQQTGCTMHPRPVQSILASAPPTMKAAATTTAELKASTAQELSGGSDPLQIEAWHEVLPERHEVTMHLKLHNMTPIELYEVRLSCSLEGAATFADGSAAAWTSFQEIASKQSVAWRVNAHLENFSGLAFYVQVGFAAESSTAAQLDGFDDDDDDLGGAVETPSYEGGGGVDSSWELPQHAGETVIRCAPYLVPPAHLLVPHQCDEHEFPSVWAHLEAARVQTLHVGVSSWRGLHEALSQCRCLSVVHATPPEVEGTFQAALMGFTIFGELVAFTLTGAAPGCARFEVRANEPAVADIFADARHDLPALLSGGLVKLARDGSVLQGVAGGRYGAAWHARWMSLQAS